MLDCFENNQRLNRMLRFDPSRRWLVHAESTAATWQTQPLSYVRNSAYYDTL